jgi:histidinol-phosphate aminotransferase
MFILENLVRKNILQLQPYSSARDEYTGTQGIYLDANENPFGNLNRYPDPKQIALKKRVSEIKNIHPENIFIGNGSDEAIDLLFRIFCNPGVDQALTFTPTYGMYTVSAAINQVHLVQLNLDETFQINFNTLDNYLKDETLKLIFICSPNNPTGNNIHHLERVLKNFQGIVVVDEAYIDFSESPSYLSQLHQYPNLVIIQTLSKAWGLAAARVGMAYASKNIVDIFNKVKPPYNVSALNQQAALDALNDVAGFEKNKKILLEQKLWLENELKSVSVIKKIYPSNTNFILVETPDANSIYQQLVGQGLIVRNRHSLIKNCLRITVGNPVENEQLLNALKKIA